jgi:LacI family transcriptional regulator
MSPKTTPADQIVSKKRDSVADVSKRPLKGPTIALLIESSRASGRALLGGIAKCAHHYGPWAFYWEPGGLEKAWPKLKAKDVDGIILRDVHNLKEVLTLGIPTVVIGHSKTLIPNLVNVVTDSYAIGQMGAEHLLRCGFKHFAFYGYPGVPWSDLRLKYFGRYIRKAGFGFHVFRDFVPAANVWSKERHKMAAWLQSLPKPVGLMACNDDCGQQVIEACKLANLGVPDAVGVLGTDNDELVCGLSDPPMSSVDINFEHAGYEAALVLFRLLRGVRPVSLKINVRPTRVITRHSTDFMAVSDSYVTKALQFIRDHAHENMMVMNVASAAALSRRALEIKFRREIGCSIYEHIRRVRTDQIVRLLVETDLQVGQIAESLGFSDMQHFARYFRAGKQISPLAYRRTYGRRAG